MTVRDSLNDSIFAFFFSYVQTNKMKNRYNEQEGRGLNYDHVDMCMCVVHTQASNPCNPDCLSLVTLTEPRPSLRSAEFWVPLRILAELELPGQHKPDQGEESGTQPSSCGSCGPSSVEAEGVPVVGEGANWCHFL